MSCHGLRIANFATFRAGTNLAVVPFVRRPLIRSIASSLAFTLVGVGFLTANAHLFSHLTSRWFGPLPESVAEPASSASITEPEPKPEPVTTPQPVRIPPKPKEVSKPPIVLADPEPLEPNPKPKPPTERLAFRPYQENGKVTGLQFSGVPSGSLFDLLGLKKDDVLLNVNGYALNDPEQGLRAYAALRRAPLLRVVVMREGRPVEIVIHVL